MKARYRATDTGRAYHTPDCDHVHRWDARALRTLTAADVIRLKLVPCQTCKPPPPMGLAATPTEGTA